MSWATASTRVLLEIAAENPQQQGESLEDWGKRMKRAIADGYPFAQRSGFAYKVWCREKTSILYDLGIVKTLPKKSSRAIAERAAMPHPGQLNLLDVGGKNG